MANYIKQLSSADDPEGAALRRLIWVYFWLLIFEGALRKWVPPLSTPLLVARDPLVLLIYLRAVRCHRFPINGPILVYFCLVICFVLLAVVQIVADIGGGPVVVAYGLRTNFLHLPLLFVIPQVFSSADVLKLGRWMLILCIPMTALMIVQYLSPPGSWINAAPGADGGQIEFTMGKIRAAGTFSFASGAAHFFTLATAFVIYAIADRSSNYSKWLIWGALLSLVVVQPVSGSRTLVLGCALVAVSAMAFTILSPRQAPRIVAVICLVCTAAAILSLTSFFRNAQDVFMVRWNDASAASGGTEQGLVGRFFGTFMEPIGELRQAGWIGNGLGMGTNAGAAMVTGSRVFLLAEGEWARIVLEAGPLLGFSYLAYRVWLAAIIGLRAAFCARQGHMLPWLLAWNACLSMLTEQMSQPTNLGFMVLAGGLCLAAASCRDSVVASAKREWQIESSSPSCALD